METDVEERLLQVCQGQIKRLELIFEGFRTLTEASIHETDRMKEEVQRHSSDLARFLIGKTSSGEKEKEWVKPYLSMASSFERMGYNMDGMVDRLNSMLKERIPFSDRAIKEVNDIFQEAMDLLESLPDLIQKKDILFAQHMGERVRSILKIANGYSEEHEERLIQGVCVPKSSPIYLGLIESLRGVIAHTLEIGGKIVSLAAKA